MIPVRVLGASPFSNMFLSGRTILPRLGPSIRSLSMLSTFFQGTPLLPLAQRVRPCSFKPLPFLSLTRAFPKRYFHSSLQMKTPIRPPVDFSSIQNFMSHVSINKDQWRKILKKDPTGFDLALDKYKFITQDSLDELLKLFKEEPIEQVHFTFPRGVKLNRTWVKEMLIQMKKINPTISILGALNPKAEDQEVTMFSEASISDLKEMEKTLKLDPSPIMGYQMENVPLNEDYIEAIADHVMALNEKNIVLLIFADQPEVTFI